MKDLAPDIYRQRMIIEGIIDYNAINYDIENLLNKLCKELYMVKLTNPTTHFCEKYGWCGWMHWETSGVHMYVWRRDDETFFSIDIYTCKPFIPETAIVTVKQFFGHHLKDLEWKEV